MPASARCNAVIRRALAFWAVAATLAFAREAGAYRPFDGTDADTAETGGFELELGPAHYYLQGSQSFLITPAVVLNLGIFKDTELVIDANSYIALGPLSAGVSRASLLGDDVLIKHVFREGALQGKSGVSFAAEGGVLTPQVNGINGERGVSSVGGSLDVITSYRWSWGTVHYNEWFELTRDQHGDLFTGLILEGPHDWRIRPVAELYFDEELGVGHTESLLVGAIWTLRRSFVLDAGLRGARIGDVCAAEARLGLTWALPVWSRTENAAARAPSTGQ